MQRVWRLNDACQLALKVEAKLTRGRGKKYVDVRSLYPPSKSESSRGGHVGSKIGGTNKSTAKPNTSNHGGGQATHTNRFPTCFKCGQGGHYLRDCPKRRVDAHVNLADEEVDGEHEDPFVEPKYDDDDEVEYEEIGPEKGDCLVIQRALTTPKVEEDEEATPTTSFPTLKAHGKFFNLPSKSLNFFISEIAPSSTSSCRHESRRKYTKSVTQALVPNDAG
ncbi:hypothetical protein MRB53_009631 [Persea americana]|uniref:Uncharacterized protein n=1 Tax=Persea americana TaxID=3435 RepID=A0ACC2LPJ5_PERAE|nr:hypothetical protein MRB53_009631 [Persea americana]